MPFDTIIWDPDDDSAGNVQHCGEHSVSKEEVEEVFKTRRMPISVGLPAGP